MYSLAAQFKADRKRLSTDLAAWLDTRFREEITSAKWAFPTPPQVRDIVESGRLRDSQKHTVSPEGVITFEWTAPYATEVHEGGVGLNGGRFPGRPWTRDPLAELPTKVAQLMANRTGRSS